MISKNKFILKQVVRKRQILIYLKKLEIYYPSRIINFTSELNIKLSNQKTSTINL
jgi:hypothetical protein